MFTRAVVRPPGDNFSAGLTSTNLAAPEYTKAKDQHEKYCAALERCGLALTKLEADHSYPDSTFVEDTAILTEQAAILARPGAPSRAGEVHRIKETLADFFSLTPSIQPPGTLDGGDVCQVENHFLIGISDRTNEVGAAQLEELLASLGHTSSFINIRGGNSILHLKSGIGYLGDNRLVVIDALATREEFRGYDVVRIKQEEEYAANCLRVNDHVLVPVGYPVFEGALRRLGYQTIALDMSEFQKMDGGLSCLSLRF